MSHLTRAARRLAVVVPVLLAVGPTSAHAAATLAIEPSQVDFGAHPAGMSADRTVTIRNQGPDATALSDVVIEGEEAAVDRFDFVDGDCVLETPLPAGGECQITLRFSTLAGMSGTFEALLWAEGGPEDLSTSARLVGAVQPPSFGPAKVVVEPAALVFPATMLGAVSAEQQIRIRNEGPGAATAFGVLGPRPGASSAPFRVQNRCPALLPAGAECSIGVTFAPWGRAGAQASTVRITWDGFRSEWVRVSGIAESVPVPYPHAAIDRDLARLADSLPKVLRGAPRRARLSAFQARVAGSLRVRVFARFKGRRVLVAHGERLLASGAEHRLQVRSTALGRKLLLRPRQTRISVVAAYVDRLDGDIGRQALEFVVKPPKAKRPAKRKRR